MTVRPDFKLTPPGGLVAWTLGWASNTIFLETISYHWELDCKSMFRRCWLRTA